MSPRATSASPPRPRTLRGPTFILLSVVFLALQILLTSAFVLPTHPPSTISTTTLYTPGNGNASSTASPTFVASSPAGAPTVAGLGPLTGTLSPMFWGTVPQTTTSTGIRTNPGIGQFLNATPFTTFRYTQGTEQCNITANLFYSDSGSTTSPCGFNITAYKVWCASRPVGCISLLDLPGENNNSREDAAMAAFIVNTLRFQPSYWSIGNEPMLWKHYGEPWTSWSTSDNSAPTPQAYAWDVHAAITAVKRVDPSARFIGIQADCECSPQWFADTVLVNGPNLSAIAYHTYPYTAPSTPETLAQFYAPLSSGANITTSYATVRAAIVGKCAQCSTLPIFTTEYNAGPGWTPSNWAGTFPNALFLAASTVQAMRANVAMFMVYNVQTSSTTAYGYSMVNGNDVVGPTGLVYSDLLSHMVSGAVHAVHLATSVPSVWPVITTNGTHESLLVVNANLTQSVVLDPSSLLQASSSASTFLWTTGETAPVLSTEVMPTSLLLLPQSILLINTSIPSASTPQAYASSNVSTGLAPLSVSFTGSGTGGVPPYAFSWSFGDGTQASGANSSHVYTTVGSYHATLTLSDQQGGSSSSSLAITVENAPIPPLALTVSSSAGSGTAPLSTTFISSVQGGVGPYSYAWSFSDGSLGSAASGPSHTFNASGTYVVKCVVQDSRGDRANASTSVIVLAPLPPLHLVESSNVSAGTAPLAVAFTANATGGQPGYVYSWNLGTGTSATGPSANGTYTAPGNYTVTVTVSDAQGAHAQASQTITVGRVSSGLSARMEVNATLGTAPLEVQFGVQASGSAPPYSYSWSFGDGTPASSSSSPVHLYGSPGTFTTSVQVASSSGATVVLDATITAYPALSVFLSPSSSSASSGQWFEVVAQSTGGYGPLSYRWSVNGSVVGENRSMLSWSESTPGSYVITVVVSDSRGDQRSGSTTILVSASPSPSQPGGSSTPSSSAPSWEWPLAVALVGVAAVLFLFLAHRVPRHRPGQRIRGPRVS